jgi:CheY-like chemotaxis protein
MKTILVVDDESQVVELMKNRLEANHYNVISASDGAEGIKKAQQEKPDLILMDILMPNLSGGEAVKILQANPATKRIPVIFFTAAVGDMSQGTETGSINVDGHFFTAVAKPFRPEPLLNEIEKLIGY